MKKTSGLHKRLCLKDTICLDNSDWIWRQIEILEENISKCESEDKKRFLLEQLQQLKEDFDLE